MNEHVRATPYGRSTLSLGQLAAAATVRACPPETVANRRSVLRDVVTARSALGLAPNALNVLEALLSFLPGDVMSAGADVVVHAGNDKLQRRLKGLDLRSIRRHIASLIEAGLVMRRDSPNGKRYVKRGPDGERAEVYGFDLSPLVARASYIAAIAAEIEAEQRRAAMLREQVQTTRRFIRQALALAMEHELPGDWDAVRSAYSVHVPNVPRGEGASSLEQRLADLKAIARRVDNLLPTCGFPVEESTNAGQVAPLHLKSNTESISCSEPAAETAGAARSTVTREEAKPTVQLGLVLKVCPDIADYAGDPIRSWRDLSATANVVRSSLGISPSAWEEARREMGETEALTTLAAILQRSSEIRSAGGYLRALTQKAKAGSYSSANLIMSQFKRQLADAGAP
jgi:replication initiation protein RepC